MNYQNFCKVLDHIERNPQLHNQSWYRDDTECGTTHCFIGWSAVFARGYYLANRVKEDACDFLDIGLKGDMMQWIVTTARTVDDFRRVRLVAGWINFAKKNC
jgi:hypothetical protein